MKIPLLVLTILLTLPACAQHPATPNAASEQAATPESHRTAGFATPVTDEAPLPAARFCPCCGRSLSGHAGSGFGCRGRWSADGYWRSERHELRLSAGAGPLFVEAYCDEDIAPRDFASTKYYKGDVHSTGAYALSYYYRFARRWEIGLSCNFTHEYYRIYSNMDNSVSEHRSVNYLTVMPSIRFTWLHRRSLRLYSAYHIGLTYVSGSGDFCGSTRVGLQLTYIGLSAGRRLFGFAELGVGAQGIAVAGIGYRFLSKKDK